MQIFESFYKKLNSAQCEAVDAIDGPVMVVAGPGTGKTQILTLRIANILKQTDTEPRNILALTFTESGVSSMRRRLADIIGSRAYGVSINTFHGFCNDIIKNYPEEFPRIIGSTNITEVDQINIIEQAIEKLPLKILRPFGEPMFYARDILKAINDLKREDVNPEKFEEILEGESYDLESREDLYHTKGAYKGKIKGEYQKLFKELDKNYELAKVYKHYEKIMEKRKLYDYSDMLVEVLRELRRNKDLLLTLQEEYQYILVDEHQDTNNVQNKILEFLCNFHANPNIFVVGDEKQAIFRFQGASLENFLYFKKLYRKAKLIVLEENYRSTQTILDSAHSVLPHEVNLKARAKHTEEKIALYAFSRPEVENYFVAQDISAKIKSGVSPHEIAVLYRDNKDALSISGMLEKVGVPFTVQSDEDILADNDLKKIILLIRAVNGFGSGEYLVPALHIDFLGIAPLDIYKLLRYSNENKIKLFDLVSRTKRLEKIDLDSLEKVRDLYRKLSSWAIFSKNRGLSEFFEVLINESGFLKHILSLPDASDKMDKLNGIFQEIKSLSLRHKNYGLKELVEYLDTLESHRLPIKKSVIHAVPNRVRLMTAHRSKGQEFEYVYIINAYDGHWGNKHKPAHLTLPRAVFSLVSRAPDNSTNLDDERRLFYVALTRAKKSIVITYARESDNKKELLQSQFIGEMRPELVDQIDVLPYEEEFSKKSQIIFAPKIVYGMSAKDKDFVREIFARNGLSVSGLNNYLRCPWEYFYTNLLRIPKAKTKHQMYGTAIHAALASLLVPPAVALQSGAKEGRRFLLEKFQFYLAQEPLSETEYDELLEKGQKSLAGYYDAYSSTWTHPMKVEFPVDVMLTKDLRLTGKIDRMDILNDSHEVTVIDYKTSKPKTRTEIEGKTKNSEGNEKRQLIFYKLLLDNYSSGRKYNMVQGVIDFVEPDEKGRYRKEAFTINKSEVTEMEKLVKQTAGEILNLSFWDKKCGDKDCEFCELRNAMS